MTLSLAPFGTSFLAVFSIHLFSSRRASSVGSIFISMILRPVPFVWSAVLESAAIKPTKSGAKNIIRDSFKKKLLVLALIIFRSLPKIVKITVLNYFFHFILFRQDLGFMRSNYCSNISHPDIYLNELC